MILCRKIVSLEESFSIYNEMDYCITYEYAAIATGSRRSNHIEASLTLYSARGKQETGYAVCRTW